MRFGNIAMSLCVAGISLVVVGCAGVNFYSDSNLTTKTGIPIYAPKPYLLVARTGGTDKPVEVSVIYLNDPQHVIYADPRSGFGSSNLTLGLSNGQLTTFGQQADARISEFVTSLAALVGARAGVMAAVGAASQPTTATVHTQPASAPNDRPAPTLPAFELYEIVQGANGASLRRISP